MKLINVLLALALVSIIVLFIEIAILSSIVKNNKIQEIKRNNLDNNNYNQNREYLINYNVAQYSSYIIEDRIQALIKLNYKHVTDFGEKEMFKCLIKRVDNLKVIAELEAYNSFKLTTNSNKILIFKLSSELVTDELLLDKLVVAVIWKNDYNKSLNIFSSNQTITKQLPYSLIKFQKPVVIRPLQPRLPSVSLCVHYTYAIPSQLINWFDLQLSFGVREIMIYDAIDNKALTKLLRNTYGNDERIVTIPYNMSLNDLCNETALFKQYENNTCPINLRRFLSNACQEFFDTEFLDKYEWRDRHEKITVNDCFTVLSQKHEFIGHYDLDEFVYTRSMNSLQFYNDKNSSYSCSKRDSICSTSPFNFNTHNYYNYLNSLIRIYGNGRNKSDLRSIVFSHAFAVTSNDLIEQLNSLIKTIKTNKQFPFRLFFTDSLSNDAGHIFIIKKNDFEYVEYLVNAYQSLIPCAKALEGVNNFDKSLIRYFYFITDEYERMGKAIHYYKNVNSIWVHQAIDVDNNSWTLYPSSMDGHFLPHYRENIIKYFENHTGSIRKLNIDFEYVFYLLKYHTSFCDEFY